MINLAPLRYSRVLHSDGGPIQHVECATTSVMGERLYQANAVLSDSLRTWSQSNVLFGNVDGSGTAANSSVAQHMAISEALERWAHHAVYRSTERGRYGFDIDPSSNGMAAFPGLTRRQARENALAEAAERFCLAGWWIGALDGDSVASPWPDVDLMKIENPVSSHAVVVLHALADQDLHAYGFGAGKDVSRAARKAAVELARSQYVLKRFARRGPYEGTCTQAHNLFERRCLFFSTPEGYDLFRERHGRRKWLSVTPQCLFDGEVPGPWSRFAYVWRVVFQPPSTEFLAPTERFFFW